MAICLILVMLISCISLSAQQIPTRHYTMKDGLPSMGVRCVFKDSRGLIWIGTDGGLCNFDGKSFKILKISDGTTAGKIWSIAEDEVGNMWFGSFGSGIFRFDGHSFEQFTKKDGLVDDWVRVLCYSKNFNCLIVGSTNGVSTVKGNKITASPKSLFTARPDYCVTGIMDAGKFIYITTYAGNNPLRYYPDQNKFISLNDSKGRYPLNSFGCYLSSGGDTVFEAGAEGVKIFSRDNKVVLNETLGQVFGFSEDNSGNLWFAAWSYTQKLLEGGIYKYDGTSFKNYKSAFGITDIEIWTVFFDKEQEILWVGTLNEGLFMIPFPLFSEYDASFFNVEKLKINNLFVDSENTLRIADNSNLISKRADDTYSVLNNRTMVEACRKMLADSRNIALLHNNNNIRYLLKPDNSNTLNSRNQDGLGYKYLAETTENSILFSNKYGLFSCSKNGANIKFLRAGIPEEMSILGSDTLVIGGWGPTNIIPDFKKNLQALNETPQEIYGALPPPKDINRIFVDKHRVWYASWLSGLWMSEGLRFINFNKTNSSISNDLTDICTDSNGNIIFGSNTGEIYIGNYDGQKLSVKYKISNLQGLVGNSISWLTTDRKGNLWAGTNLGINCIDLSRLYQTGKYLISFFDGDEGFSGQTAKRVAFDSDENLWIGANDRLIKLDTRKLKTRNKNPGKIILTGLEINHQPHQLVLKTDLDPWTLLPEKEFTLLHSENSIVFFFDILNYLNPQKDRFRYLLKGYDTKWSDFNESRRAVYTNLREGNYTFCIESYNINTGEKGVPLEVKFVIHHPWWKLWYVQIFFVIVILVFTYLAVKRTIATVKLQERQKVELEKKIAQLEIQALQAQMNPHFIFNSINSIQYFVLSNKTDEVLSYLSDFSKIVRASLDNVTKKMVSLDQEIDFLKSYLRIEKMRFPKRFDFSIKILGELDPLSIMIPPFLIQPFAENAVRHGFLYKRSPGRLSITIELLERDVIRCSIIDDGVGRIKAREIEGLSEDTGRLHSSEITETRIRLFNPQGQPSKYKVEYTDLFNAAGEMSGLKVDVYIPVDLP